MSNCDTNVSLTEGNWAITVVSTLQRSQLNRSNDCGFGHVMIVCEGLENGSLFFKYAHIIDRGNGSEAEVKTENKKIKSDTLNGPTWSRQRHLVERMLQSIRDAEVNHRYVSFSKMRDLVNLVKYVGASAISIVPGLSTIVGVSSNRTFNRPNIDQIRDNSESPHNCASWVRKQLLEAGIKIQLPFLAITPNRMVTSLKDERNVTFVNEL
ncbi:MAG: hypothetical protein P0S93_01270 [Candidatus Neptunochlamydia sp.]|nr:hypothetical protein [Candidatus Neptunochlamydia sp.]